MANRIKPDRSGWKPNRIKTPEKDWIDLAWAEGETSDGRPYRLELWAMDQTTFLNVFMSTEGIEHYGSDQFVELLESERIVWWLAGTEKRAAASAYRDSAGNEVWQVNILVGEEFGPSLVGSCPLFPHPPEPTHAARSGAEQSAKHGGSDDEISLFPRVLERGGLIAIENFAAVRDREAHHHTATSFDAEIAAELLAIAPASELVLDVVAPEDGGFTYRIHGSGKREWEASLALKVHVAALYQFSEDRQCEPWSGLHFELRRVSDEKVRYEVQFRYA